MLNVQKVSPIKVEDNFLRQGEFETLKEWFINSRSDIDNCPWMYSPHVIGPQGDDPNDFQFIHVFWFPNRGVVSRLPSQYNSVSGGCNSKVLNNTFL